MSTTTPTTSPRGFCVALVATTAALAAIHGPAHARVISLGDAINKAGRQRMLSQRMAEFYMANMWNVDTATSLAELTKARSEFIAAQELLRTAPEATADIRQELALADSQ